MLQVISCRPDAFSRAVFQPHPYGQLYSRVVDTKVLHVDIHTDPRQMGDPAFVEGLLAGELLHSDSTSVVHAVLEEHGYVLTLDYAMKMLYLQVGFRCRLNSNFNVFTFCADLTAVLQP